MFAPSPGNKILRQMGYIKDQEGILNRYFRESEGWEQHLVNSSEFIIKCLKNKKVKELIVFGSGWLLDFPLEILAAEIEHIKLVDIHHPAQIQKKVKNFPGVECISADITGGYIETIYNEVQRCKKLKIPFTFSGNTCLPQFSFHENSYAISLNVLNQLDILIIDYLKQKMEVSENTVRQIRERLQKDHLDLLKTVPSILITDYEELLINRDGKSETVKSLLYTELFYSRYTKEWSWLFDAHGLYNPDGQTVLKVRAICSESPEIQ
jgi:hypothetical protein